MVEEIINIGTYNIDKEARYETIKEWTRRIKPIKIFEVTDVVIAIIYALILASVYGLFSWLIIWIILSILVFIYFLHIKKPKESEVLEEYPPNSIKFKCGVIENSIPATVEVKNADDEISIKYSIWGSSSSWGWGAKNINKLKEKWTSLTNDLEQMLIKTAASAGK